MGFLKMFAMTAVLFGVGCAPSLDRAAVERSASPLKSVTISGPKKEVFAVTIPSDNQWRRIINYFERPTYVIAPISRTPGWLTCPEKGTELQVQDANGNRISLLPAAFLYGWSSDCQSGSYNGSFSAEPGQKVTVSISVALSDGPQSFIVAAAWKNKKDKLVGLQIDHLLSDHR